MKFGAGLHYKNLPSQCEFRGERHSGGRVSEQLSACPIWVKFGTTYLQTCCEVCLRFMKTGTGETVLLLWVYMKLHFSVYRETMRHFESKERLANARVHQMQPTFLPRIDSAAQSCEKSVMKLNANLLDPYGRTLLTHLARMWTGRTVRNATAVFACCDPL